jgi:hypothetical protein
MSYFVEYFWRNPGYEFVKKFSYIKNKLLEGKLHEVAGLSGSVKENKSKYPVVSNETWLFRVVDPEKSHSINLSTSNWIPLLFTEWRNKSINTWKEFKDKVLHNTFGLTDNEIDRIINGTGKCFFKTATGGIEFANCRAGFNTDIQKKYKINPPKNVDYSAYAPEFILDSNK